ncbi:MAG: PAS domain-containing protein, partial [Rhizomicrobium sp.]
MSASGNTGGLLTGGGDMAARIAAYDWSASLGPVASWPQSLKTIVGFMMLSPVALVLLWGEDGIMLYNDAYSKFAGRRHPQLLGSKVREGWPEVADFNDNVMKVGLAGGTLSYKEQVLTLDRRGTMEPAWLDLDYSPVIDESGRPGGVLAIVVEITDKVINARNLAESEKRLQTALSAGRGVGTWDWNVQEDRVFADERFARLYGVDPERARTGAPLAEFFGNIHQNDLARVMADVQQALKTGERFNSVYRLNQADGGVRWVEAEGRCSLDGQGRPLHFPGVSFDVTEAREVQIRLTAVAELGDRIRDTDDPDALTYAAAEILGRTLNVSRAGYGTIDPKAETITIERDWNAPGIKSLAGVLNFRDYGSYIEDLKRGETVVFADARLDPRTRATADALEAISARALVNMPVREAGGLVALLYLNHVDARKWTDAEIGFIREMAERTRTAVARLEAESELRANEAQFESFAQAVPNHVWAGTPDGQLYWFNQQTLDYSGMSLAALAGDGWAQIVHPEDVAAAASAWKRALVSGQTYETEFRIRRADGAYRWHVVRALPIRNADGAVIRWVGTNTDIQERQETASALRELNAELERKVIERTQARGLTWQVSPDLMGALNSKGYFETSNPAWKAVLGWSEEEVASMSIFELLHPDDVERTRAGFALTQIGQPAMRFPNRYRSKDGGYRWISW